MNTSNDREEKYFAYLYLRIKDYHHIVGRMMKAEENHEGDSNERVYSGAFDNHGSDLCVYCCVVHTKKSPSSRASAQKTPHNECREEDVES